MEEIIVILKCSTISVLAGFVLDLIFGDPKWMPHPVVFIGKMIVIVEKITRKIFPKTKMGERIAGSITAISVIFISTILPLLILWGAYNINIWLYIIIESFMCYEILATKALKVESKSVQNELEKGEIKKARYSLSMIVGRDTENLTESEIVKGAVETVAENTADGVIAPLIYIIIGGAPLGFFYKAINTLDSMIGYKNHKYQYFGTFAAKMDDLANYIPSRLSAFMMIISSFFCGYNTKNAYKIWRRDRKNHHSPNSAQTESVAAGALEIQLAGNAYYGGVLKEKKYIGDDIKKIESSDIKRANTLTLCTAVISLIIFVSIKIGVIFII